MFSRENHPERVAIIVDHLYAIPDLTPQRVFDELHKIWELLGKKLQPPGWGYDQFVAHVKNQFLLARQRDVIEQLRNAHFNQF